MTILATPISIVRPLYALSTLIPYLNRESIKITQKVMGIGVKAHNTHSNRSVFTAPYHEQSEECSFADSDICLSYFLHLAKERELLLEVFEENPLPIVDRNVLFFSKPTGDSHIAFRMEEQGGVELFLIPALQPDQLEHYQFVRVHMVA